MQCELYASMQKWGQKQPSCLPAARLPGPALSTSALQAQDLPQPSCLPAARLPGPALSTLVLQAQDLPQPMLPCATMG